MLLSTISCNIFGQHDEAEMTQRYILCHQQHTVQAKPIDESGKQSPAGQGRQAIVDANHSASECSKSKEQHTRLLASTTFFQYMPVVILSLDSLLHCLHHSL